MKVILTNSFLVRHVVHKIPGIGPILRRKNTSLLPTYVFERRKSTALKWSYLMGPSDTSLIGLTIGQTVDRASDLYGDNEAIVSRHQNIKKTYTEVKKESDHLAAGFLSLGFQPGDRIGIWGPNSYEWYLTECAAGKAGLILVNINPSYRSNELKYCLNKVAVKGIICAQKFKTSDYYKMLTEIVPELPTSVPGQLSSKEVPHLKTVIMMGQTSLSGTFSFESTLKAGDSTHFNELHKLATKIQFDDPCNIQFTSGTTGLPKAALLSHHNLVNNAYFVGRRCGYQTKPLRICVSVPLYHCFGCVIGVLSSALNGCTVILPSEGFNPKEIVKSFEEEKVNSCYGTPTMFVDILKEFKNSPVNVESLSCGIMAGAPCPEELVTALINDLNMKDFMVMYGMTETSPVSFQCFPSDPPTVRAQTIGYPGDHVEVKIVNEDGEIVGVGESGELCLRGYCNFLGYWGDEAKTKEMVSNDRWLKSGDLAVLNKDGYGAIIGRIKDMIIRGGENIYPAELENFFMAHPDILEAQVFGIPDERMGEEVALWVRLEPESKLSDEDIRSWSKGKIAHYKIPKYIRIKLEFPVTVTGKVQKFVMKEEEIKNLGLKKP